MKPWLVWLLIAVLIAGAIFGIDYYRHRFVRSDSDMVALLPQAGLTVFFADVSDLRKAGVFDVFAASKATAEPEYREFVRRTHFDYTKDIRALAGVVDSNHILLAIRGRFDWGRLRAYALTHGGVCKNTLCNFPTTRPGRWISFFPIQPDVMGLAVASDSAAAMALLPHGNRASEQMPRHPVWVKVAPSVFRRPGSLPFYIRIFAISLQPADHVLLSLDVSRSSSWPFILELDAHCPTIPTAETMKAQLDLETRILRMELGREHQRPRPGDLTGMLVAGSFNVSGKRVIGTWPIRQDLLKTLE